MPACCCFADHLYIDLELHSYDGANTVPNYDTVTIDFIVRIWLMSEAKLMCYLTCVLLIK